MKRPFLVIALLAFMASSASAQVYEGKSKSDVKRWIKEKEAENTSEARKERAKARELARIKAAEEARKAEEERVAKEKARTEAVRANRDKQIVRLIEDEEKRGKKLYKAFEDRVLDKAKKNKNTEAMYELMEARVQLGCGLVKDAKNTLRRMRNTNPPEVVNDAYPAFMRDRINDVRKADHLRLYYELDVIENFRLEFEDWDQAAQLNLRQTRATKDAKDGAKDIIRDTKGKDGFIPDQILLNSEGLTTWANNIKSRWVQIWRARSLMLKNPMDSGAVFRFARLCVQTDAAHLNLIGINLLEDLALNFKNARETKDGYVGEVLAEAYVKIWDYESAITAIEAGAENASRKRKNALKVIRRRIITDERAFKSAFK